MTPVKDAIFRPRKVVICAYCRETFHLSASNYEWRMRHSKTGCLYCSEACRTASIRRLPASLRNQEIILRRGRGDTVAKIAAEMGISKSRVFQIYMRYKDRAFVRAELSRIVDPDGDGERNKWISHNQESTWAEIEVDIARTGSVSSLYRHSAS